LWWQAVFAEKRACGVISNSDKPLHETLSGRQHQLLLLIAAGKPPS